MKKSVMILFLLVSSLTYAQRFQLGVKAGANISNFNNAEDFADAKAKSLVGFHGGLYTRFSMRSFAIQPEVMISTQGAKLDSISGGSADWKLTYINIPVMMQFLSAGGFYIEAGPQVGFKISENTGDQTIENFAKDLDVSIAAGFGFRNKRGLGLGGRYNLGLSKVSDISNNNDIDPDFKNAVIQISLYVPLTR
jgi:hypothetical protein